MCEISCRQSDSHSRHPMALSPCSSKCSDNCLPRIPTGGFVRGGRVPSGWRSVARKWLVHHPGQAEMSADLGVIVTEKF